MHGWLHASVLVAMSRILLHSDDIEVNTFL
jgi:hypothetical protein